MDLTDQSLSCILILRGLPGSGKNTFAEEHGYKVVDSDSFFMVDGEYRFDPSRLDESHAKCFHTYLKLLANDVRRIAVCNTNITRAQYTPYVLAARAMGRGDDLAMLHTRCDIETAIDRNIHNVPPHVIGAMNALFEVPEEYDPPQYSIYTGSLEGGEEKNG